MASSRRQARLESSFLDRARKRLVQGDVVSRGGSAGDELACLLLQARAFGPFGDEPSVLFNLCSRARSRPRQVLGVLQRLLTPTARWRVVESRFGAFAEWRPSWKRMAQELVLNLMSGVQRRLVDPFETPLYSNLVPFANPSTSIEERRGNSRGFVRRAKRHVGSVQPQVATPSAVCWRVVGQPLLGSFSVSLV